MDNSLDQTTLATLSLLESRLLRIEYLLYGQTVSPPPAQQDAALRRMKNLERRFSMMVSQIRVYGELLKIYRSHPDLFHAPKASEPPSQLSMSAIRSIVLASASAFPSTLSSLTNIKDSPIPDLSESAALISSAERMKSMEATQIAQLAEISDLRRRSEAAMLSWYEKVVLTGSQGLADVESRVQGLERLVRRKELAVEEGKQL
ncbi:uncharacterized protein UV8b_02322 [Ustilaginoidea virens]|uniref:Nuclear distribution protein n=1 Tax=Ustilaginoidea virens TaxID=1159556 RepID=A0A8E5MG05_USTVR|nr:uncharacterized protein UV8b_02322 [Ustilaginoidea virens]QUC18081.1 hypothetical protein UV8b_02322 [Ustilaginoidea virens]